MKWILRIGAIGSGAVIVGAAALCGWLYLYTADLPSLFQLSQYDPASPSEIHIRQGDAPESVRHVVPSNGFGKYLVDAVVAAEGQPEPRGPIRVTFAALLTDSQPRGRMYSFQLARDLVPPGREIRRQIDELRLAEQIHRRFDQQQVLTMFMNRVYLGDSVYGFEDGSFRYFGKHAADLSLDEAALLAGLIRSPHYDSPVEHPERAVQRRNWVIDQMGREGSVSQDHAEVAKTAALVFKKTADSTANYDWNRCALKLASEGPPNEPTFHVHPGDTLKNTPVITFQILESGEVKDVAISRRSGIADIDKTALAWITKLKYDERPAGCGIIESQVAVTVDLR